MAPTEGGGSSPGPSPASARSYDFGELTLTCVPGGRLDRLCVELKEEFPALRMRRKSDHWHWRALHWLVLIFTFGGNRRFNTAYTTTIRRTIGWSDKQWERIKGGLADWEDRIWSTLTHEREHLRDFARLTTPVMGLLYLLVLPVVFTMRAYFEKKGYLETLRCWHALHPRGWPHTKQARDWWISQFTGGGYGWMLPFKKTVGKWYDEELDRLHRAFLIKEAIDEQ